ncbi:helix-turn-helix domain-containing protein [Paucilactobacillus vaccinostercus]|nr:XRE family transcriptional regulator [Paucilactobacillus vaccinostercus]
MFFGEKLTQLRELNGLSRKELADKLTISEQAVWQYETDNLVPRIEILNQIKTLFSVDTKFFFQTTFIEPVVSEEHVAYRAKDRDSRKKTKLELTYLDYVDYYINYFEKFLVTPTSSITKLQLQIKPFLHSSKFVEDIPRSIAKIASYSRQSLQLHHNKDLMYVLESSGIYILEKDLGTEIDAYSVITKHNRSFIILGSLKKTAVRRNFDLAHELGHLLMHEDIDMESLTKKEHREIEHQANLFAADFLLPEEEFTADFAELQRKSNPDSYLDLKRKYLVSIAAMGYHAYQLGLMNYQENRYFYGQLTKKKYKTFEPLDDEIVPIKPGRVKSLLQLIYKKQVLAVPDLSNIFHIIPSFLVKLFNLNPDFFDEYVAPKPDYFSATNIISIDKFRN